MKIALLSPGHMGSAVGRRLRDHGAEVATCVTGRSQRTQDLAREAGLTLVDDLETLVADCDVIISILVPAEALGVAVDVATAIRAAGRPVVFADLNAISPETASAIGELITAAGATFVDGSIIGPPPTRSGTTRVFVSGPDTSQLQALTEHGLDVRHVSSSPGAASALKMSFGAITKGTTALLTQSLVAAARNDVSGPLLEELQERRSALYELAEGAIPQMPMRSRRWVGEMEEIDDAFVAAGLPGGTFSGIADLYRWVGRSPLADETPEILPERTLEQVAALLAARETPE